MGFPRDTAGMREETDCIQCLRPQFRVNSGAWNRQGRNRAARACALNFASARPRCEPPHQTCPPPRGRFPGLPACFGIGESVNQPALRAAQASSDNCTGLPSAAARSAANTTREDSKAVAQSVSGMASFLPTASTNAWNCGW